jgi:hypothetical protein
MSVDFTPYVNMQLYDRDPAELYLSTLELLQLNIPGLSVKPGTIEDALVQAFSFLTTVAINHINTLPNMIMEGLANLIGVKRREAKFAYLTATVTALDYAGGQLEEGTTFECAYILGGTTYRDYFEITTPVIIDPVEPVLNANPPTALPSTTFTMSATTIGYRQPIAAGKTLTILNSQFVSDSAVALDTFEQGTEEETDAEFLMRFSTYLRALGNSLTTAQQIEAFAITQFETITRARAVDLMDADLSRAQGAASAPGYVSLFVYGDSAPLNFLARKELSLSLQERMTAGLNLIVEDIQIKNPVITASVIIEKNMNFNSAQDSIKTAVFRMLSPVQFFDAEDKLRKSFIISSIMSVPGVIYVPSFTMSCSGTTASGDDLQFTNKGVLPELLASDLTLTVTYL